MGIKKQYMVNKNWEQGIKFGWAKCISEIQGGTE